MRFYVKFVNFTAFIIIETYENFIRLVSEVLIMKTSHRIV